VDIPITCSLDAAGQQERAAAWRSLVQAASSREDQIGGVRLRFDDLAVAGEAARLATAELECCPFFEFSLHLDRTGVTLVVAAPSGAEALVDWLLGAATA
jgi:hypothetical protein